MNVCVVFTYLKTIQVKPSVLFAIQGLSVHQKYTFFPLGIREVVFNFLLTFDIMWRTFEGIFLLWS